jgi:outer membrane protein OmpA-like peptidoglycan-associated protein
MEFDKINNIYFDYSEAYIREDAAIELDKVIRVLRLCPKIVLQASSHTDSRASNSYNLKLSQDRANSVVKYILRNGKFSPDRIVSKGYGEERLANKCSDGVKCTEKEHQLNRRTHFEIYNY